MADIILRNLSVEIPVFDVGRASLRKALLGRAIGGRFAESRSHVIINALKNIDLDMHDGDRVALIGDNGSGKSTLLRIIHAFIPRPAEQRRSSARSRRCLRRRWA